jgi:hypothetical protein
MITISKAFSVSALVELFYLILTKHPLGTTAISILKKEIEPQNRDTTVQIWAV